MQQLIKITVTGVVQGVGFRAYVNRLAKKIGIKGYVQNVAEGVYIEAEGTQQQLDEFLMLLPKEKPAISSIYSIEHTIHAATGLTGFKILPTNTNED